METKAKCKYCGNEFTINKRGKKRTYCNKSECINKAKNEAQRKWYAKKMEVLKGTKNRIVANDDDGKKIIYSSIDRAIHSAKNEDFTDVIELARDLGAVRFRIVETIKSYNPDQSIYDKENEIFLHEIENLAQKDEVSQDEIVKIVRGFIDKRQDRRVIKDKQAMLRQLLAGTVKNPTAYVTEFIKKRDKRQYNPNKQGVKR